jgi:hypothetical protein
MISLFGDDITASTVPTGINAGTLIVGPTTRNVSLFGIRLGDPLPSAGYFERYGFSITGQERSVLVAQNSNKAAITIMLSNDNTIGAMIFHDVL